MIELLEVKDGCLPGVQEYIYDNGWKCIVFRSEQYEYISFHFEKRGFPNISYITDINVNVNNILDELMQIADFANKVF